MKKIFSIAMAILIVFTAAMTAEGERLTTPEELGKIKKAVKKTTFYGAGDRT